MVKMVLEPDEVWNYYVSHEEECRSKLVEIASCDDYGVVIYITQNRGDALTAIVESDDSKICEENVFSPLDCMLTIKKLYDIFLTERAIEAITEAANESNGDSEEHGDSIESIIDNREEELNIVFENLIYDIAGQDIYLDPDNSGEIISDIKEHVCEYIARKHDIPVYRPMILEGEDGEDFFEEFPYEYMIFDDPDNPLYK